jgi:hypothetical protein
MWSNCKNPKEENQERNKSQEQLKDKRLDQIRNKDIRNELGISPLSKKNNRIQE